MKKLALLAIFGLLTLGSSAQKFGHINYQELISLMPERTSMQTTLQDELNGLESHLMSMQTEYQSMVEEFKNNEEELEKINKAFIIIRNQFEDYLKKTQKTFAEVI